MRWIIASCLLVSTLATVPATATTTIYSVAYSGETAGMAGVANATEEDALSQAVNPANLTRIGSWRLDAGIGYLISRVTYDDNGINPDEFGYFEYNEGHDFVVPGIAYARRVAKEPGCSAWRPTATAATRSFSATSRSMTRTSSIWDPTPVLAVSSAAS
jgi:hypothetical protein